MAGKLFAWCFRPPVRERSLAHKGRGGGASPTRLCARPAPGTFRDMKAIELSKYRNIVVLTGAGVSVASGLPTYRGKGGLWEDAEVARYATADAMADTSDEVWWAFGPMRTMAAGASPNPGHVALADAERQMPLGGRFTVVTQNVDGLHRRAGSKNVIEYHGCIRRTRCTKCETPPVDDTVAHESAPPCTRCGAPLRPDIVLFGEWIPEIAQYAVSRALRDCDLFVAVGTSGTVHPASGFVRSAKYAGARTLLVNLEPMDRPDPAFDDEVLGQSEELLPRLFRG